MFEFVIESAEVRAARLANIVERCLHRLGDSAQRIWTYDEIWSYIDTASKELTIKAPCVWDAWYLENFPPGFNYTFDYELLFTEDGFFYGQAQVTYEDEGLLADEEEFIEFDDHIPANHTSPADRLFIVESGASATGAAVMLLPEELTDIERAAWDNRTIWATTTERVERDDAQYQTTEGEVIAYVTEDDGPRSFRKIRVPAQVADNYETEGSWGVPRLLDDQTEEVLSVTVPVVDNFDRPDQTLDSGSWQSLATGSIDFPMRIIERRLSPRVDVTGYSASAFLIRHKYAEAVVDVISSPSSAGTYAWGEIDLVTNPLVDQTLFTGYWLYWDQTGDFSVGVWTGSGTSVLDTTSFDIVAGDQILFRVSTGQIVAMVIRGGEVVHTAGAATSTYTEEFLYPGINSGHDSLTNLGPVFDNLRFGSYGTTTGNWGIPRRIPGWHPMGDTEGWGSPRRFYRDGKNVRVEGYRHPRIGPTDSELPDRFFLYMADYAQWQALKRNGPGQDYKLAELYKQRWMRGVDRVKRRMQSQDKLETRRMGGSGGYKRGGPPRPKLPWQYGQCLR